MKKIISFIGIILAVALGLIVYNYLPKQKLGQSAINLTNNPIDSLTGYATSTQSYCSKCPVKVLDKATSRSFAIITTDSIKPVYLFFPADRLGLNFTNTSTTGHLDMSESFINWQGSYYGAKATATITDLTKGYKITSTSTPFVIDLSRQINSEVWASTTPEAGIQNIYVMYSQ
jgi:hypothetical protein